MIFKKIIKIQKLKNQKVYDICLKKNHTFMLSNNLLSHNSETRGLVEGQQDYLLMFRTLSWRDKQEMCDEMRRERRMNSMQINDLGFLEKGQCYVAEAARNCKKVQITLPRTMFWQKQYGNFYKNVWERFGGIWSYTEEIKDNMNAKCKGKTLVGETLIVVPPANDNLANNISPATLVPMDNILENQEISKEALIEEQQINEVKIKKKKEEKKINWNEIDSVDLF